MNENLLLAFSNHTGGGSVIPVPVFLAIFVVIAVVVVWRFMVRRRGN